jgi:hypothetical protein
LVADRRAATVGGDEQVAFGRAAVGEGDADRPVTPPVRRGRGGRGGRGGRDDLLAAAAERVGELHIAEMTAADQAAMNPAGAPAGPETLAALIGTSLFDAATRHRTRYLAAYELALESTRQPALAAAMSQLGAGAMAATLAEHRASAWPRRPRRSRP